MQNFYLGIIYEDKTDRKTTSDNLIMLAKTKIMPLSEGKGIPS